MVRVFDRWLNRRVWHLWAYPDEVREWIDTGNPDLLHQVIETTRVIGQTLGYGVAAWACGATHRSAMRAYRGGRDQDFNTGSPAEYVLEVMVFLGGRNITGSSASVYQHEQRVREEEKDAHTRVLSLLNGGTPEVLDSISDLIQTCGLAARHLDVVREDPWLTREVVRAACGDWHEYEDEKTGEKRREWVVPDFVVWQDWAEALMRERVENTFRLKANWTLEDQRDAQGWFHNAGAGDEA